MTAIPASSYTSRTLVDGTWALTVHVEPIHRLAAQGLFGAPGESMALARLRTAAEPAPEAPPAPEKPKGGPLAKLAGRWCQSEEFQRWMVLAVVRSIGATAMAEEFMALSPEQAADDIRDICKIKSRAELDHDPAAAERFNRLIREPFAAYLNEKGIEP